MNNTGVFEENIFLILFRNVSRHYKVIFLFQTCTLNLKETNLLTVFLIYLPSINILVTIDNQGRIERSSGTVVDVQRLNFFL